MRSVAQDLFDPAAAPGIDFHQAVRLLEQLHAWRGGTGPAPREPVRFCAAASLAFPASEVESILPGAPGRPPTVTVNLMALAGVSGPLPRPLAELVIERAFRGDTAARDFLDLFHHRLLRLLHEARKKNRVSLATGTPDQARLSAPPFALLGLAAPLRGRMEENGLPDRGLLAYAGLLGRRPRSMAGLEGLLRDYFGVPVRGRQFVGRWHALDADQWTRIGAGGRNHALGRGAALGSRVWDQGAAFELEVGPLGLDRFRALLPTGGGFAPLCAAARFYAGTELDFAVRLRLRGAEVPRARLGGAGTRLGWTSWLGTRPFARPEAEVVLNGRPAGAAA